MTVGSAVIDVIERDGLRENVAKVGAALKQALADRMQRCARIGDVRGHGLFLGVQMTGREQAQAVKERLKARGILISTDGPNDDVLKIKPPLAISGDDCDRFLDALCAVL